MFAEGKNDIAHLLTSTDGRKWTDHGPLDVRKTDGSPISPGPYGTPTAWFENGTWYLFYERGDQGVWLATSKDSKIWTNVQDDPVIAMGPEPYDKAAVAVNQIVKRDGFYYAFYHANSQRPWKDWTTCLARSRDLVHWEKYPGNPIIGNNCSSAILVRTPSRRGSALHHAPGCEGVCAEVKRVMPLQPDADGLGPWQYGQRARYIHSGFTAERDGKAGFEAQDNSRHPAGNEGDRRS